jgi:hypothetical protein
MKCEKEATEKKMDCVERRVADLLHDNIVATYQVLDYQPTRLTSLVSVTNWARRCWEAGSQLANRAELQNAAGPLIGRNDIPVAWLDRFSVAEAMADNLKMSVSCGACGEDLSIPLASISELGSPATTIGQLTQLLRSSECTFCGVLGRRRVRRQA